MEEDIAIIGNNEEENITETITGGGHFNNLQLSFTNHEKDGSLHALQTAYSEVKKRLQEQLNKNAVLQTSIRDMEMQRLSSGRPNSGVFGAAGPPCEPEQDLHAQYRAEFGFAQSLERQVIRAKSTLSKLESENKQLTKKLYQLEEELTLCKKREFESSQENNSLRMEVERLKLQLRERSDADTLRLRDMNQNQDVQSRLEHKDNEIQSLREQLRGLQSGQVSLNSVNEDEKKILEQVERYSKTIKRLKEQVQEQGRMLMKQQEAICKLLESSKSASLTSSSTRLAAEGASFFPPHLEAEPPQKTPLDFSSVVFAGTKKLPLVPSFPTLQTMSQSETSQTLEEELKRINFKKSEEKVLREPTESEYIIQSPEYSNKYSPTVTTENKTSRKVSSSGPLQRPDLEETYPLDGTSFNIARKKPIPCEDISMYENLEVEAEKGISDRLRTNVGPFRQNPLKSVNQPYNPEHSDYVNVKDLNSTRGGNIPVISPRVRVLPSDDQTKPYKQPQEHTVRGMSQPQTIISRPVKTEERDGSKLITSSSIAGQILPENTLKPETRPSEVMPPSGGTRPKQVVQKSPSGNSQICPVCAQDFVNISMENFQMHVFHCMDSDSSGECGTLHNVSPTNQPTPKDVRTNQSPEKDLRICPMCDASYPSEMQSEFERHVQEHFGEEPIIDRFEVLHR